MAFRPVPAGPSTLRAMVGLRSLGGGRDFSSVPIFLREVARRYGAVAHWTVFGQRFFLLDDPALIDELLVAKARDFRKGRGVARLKRLLGDGLLSSEEPVHLPRRRMLAPAFHRERIAGYGRQMVRATLAHIARWDAAGTVAISDEMTDLTLTIAAQTLFSADMTGQSDTIRAALTTAMRAFPTSFSRVSELLDNLPFVPVTRRFVRARAELDRAIYGIIATRRQASGPAPDDLLAMLLAARAEGAGLDDRAIRDEAMTLFIAGHETTANALAWSWYLLGRHPAIARQLRAELDGVLAGRPPDPDDLPNLRLTHAIFAETLRLYPPAWILSRRAVRDTRLGGFAIPRGAVVIAAPIITHLSPRHWPEPERFAPERWLDGGAPAAKFAYFPFGGGNRLCIGEAFAWMEGVLLLATIAQRFTLEPLDLATVATEPLITLRPRSPIRMRLAARTAVTA